MAQLITRGAAERKRAALRAQQFPDVNAVELWTGKDERGFFSAPRTLPLVLRLIKKLAPKAIDPTTVYVDLLSRHMGAGIVEMGAEEDHAYSAGYGGNRAARTWRDRMEALEKLGFIRVRKRGPRPYGYTLLIHPALAVQRLREQGRVEPDWWEVYVSRQMEVGETKAADLEEKMRAAAQEADALHGDT
jgi:hypothetical protein